MEFINPVRKLTDTEEQLKNIHLMSAKYKGNLVLFDDIRIKLPKDCNLYKYEMRSCDDDDMEPAELSTSIFVNFYGTIISDTEINLPYNGKYKPYDLINNEDDFLCNWYYDFNALDLLINKDYIKHALEIWGCI